MLGTIGFERLRIRCIIGIEPHERESEQEILVDVKVETNLANAVQSDKLHDTVDYMQLAAVCKERAVSGKYFLLEKCAGDIAETIYNTFRVRSAVVTIRKLAALPDADGTFVTVRVGEG